MSTLEWHTYLWLCLLSLSIKALTLLMQFAGSDVGSQPICDGCLRRTGSTAFLLSVFACRCAAVLCVSDSNGKLGVVILCGGRHAIPMHQGCECCGPSARDLETLMTAHLPLDNHVLSMLCSTCAVQPGVMRGLVRRLPCSMLPEQQRPTPRHIFRSVRACALLPCQHTGLSGMPPTVWQVLQPATQQHAFL